MHQLRSPQQILSRLLQAVRPTPPSSGTASVGPLSGAPSDAHLSGQVTNQHGVPIVGARITLSSLDDERVLTTYSTGSGAFVFQRIEDGRYCLWVWCRGITGRSDREILFKAGKWYTLDLPVVLPAARRGDATTAQGTSRVPRLDGLRVLVVEDDETLARVLRDLLESEGGDVRVADSAARARAVADTFDPALILLDASLRDGNAFELCAQWHYRFAVPIVIVSSRANAEDLSRALGAGASDYVTKPFSLADLLERLCLAAGSVVRRAV